jgi:hypothetical protein
MQNVQLQMLAPARYSSGFEGLMKESSIDAGRCIVTHWSRGGVDSVEMNDGERQRWTRSAVHIR